ncbi:MAG: aminopeptidase P family protein [Chloroflexi bacterium]|nr:MAG: aminopeptidase P family protein [Chloroflexota bacterium]TME49739.1 MAG: aminopeptidase P family protein [Chloroflexota bacterium]
MSKSVAATTPLNDIRRWMANRHVGAAYLTHPVSIAYITGFHAEPFERLMALSVRPDGATLIVPAIERQKAATQVTGAEVVSWRDGEDPYVLVRTALGPSGEIAVEKDHLSLRAAEVITSRTGATELIDVGEEIRRLRLIKHEDEIEKLLRAAAITDAAGDEVFSRMRAGQTEVDVALMIGSVIGKLGGTLSFETLVQSGPNSALPHAKPSSRALAPGDFALLDFGAAFDGYKADTTRMAVVGEPSSKHLEIHKLVLEAHDAAIEAVRPGVTTGDIDSAARRVIEAGGYGERFFHRVGHGLGLEAHEDPSLDPGSQRILETAMVFTIEPGIYIPGFGGVRIEDDVLVEDDGCRVLTKADRSLRVITTH